MLLRDAVAGEAQRITVGELVEALASRGLAPVLMLMGFINIFTIIPGSSTVLGAPLVILGGAIALGARGIWLPRKLRERSLDRALLARGVGRALPYLKRLERLARPRGWIWGTALDRAYGAVVVVLGLLVTLPVPFGNTPPAISIVLLSLGFATRDAFWAAAGLVSTLIAFAIVAGVAGLIGTAGMSILGP
ncbi:hypothetical protein DEA8626_03475 [Defluviimonas aquaemixtae]|uniref:Exopolysaccharide synthesis, ExoD n=1 Tax=Albidovulum aquaemixtae TaxID=1542388 RepID=A0A2R8BM53_9RHOB|nr:exopolysaccharide biosynthesis protein [Defluviimonas aquaemixtae]SPH24423.1 hypothetical protein DEA8626_03475 [Defluviimonas aquaemixtae]